jgi:hypothetical protein
MHGELAAVEGLVETTDEVGASWILKPRWLGAIYYLSQSPMKKDILHIELMYRPIA